MFPFSPPYGDTPAKRNDERDKKVLDEIHTAREAAERIVEELIQLENGLRSDDWQENRAIPYAWYHRAEFVGRAFGELSHPLRYIHDASILATAYAGGYEREGA